jgi:YVTN family beta-propeller protein
MIQRTVLLAFSLLGPLLATLALGAPFAYVTQAGGNVAIIDLETRRVIRTVEISGTPGAAAVLPGERYAYVPNASRSVVSFLDTLSQAVTAEISVPSPVAIVVNPVLPRAYVASGAAADPTIIRTDTNAAVGTVAGASGATRVEVDATGRRAYFSSTSSGVVRVMNTATEALIASIPTGAAGLSGMALHPAANRLFVGDTASTVHVIDLGTNAVVATIPTGNGPDNLAFNATGTRLYVANSGSASVTVVDSQANGVGVLATIPLSGAPSGIQVDPVGEFVHVPVTTPGAVGKVELIAGNTTAVATSIGLGAAVSAAASHFIGGAAPLVTETPSILTGLWWNPAEPGWGMHFTHRRDVVFLSWFTYDDTGGPKWYVASSCRMVRPLVCATCVTNTGCTGDLYEVSGPRFFGVPFDPVAAKIKPVGIVRVDFADKDHATVAYTVVNGIRSVSIERSIFAPARTGYLQDFSDLWWSPGESGWGLAIAQQSATMFLAWFVYDDNGRPVWYVASSCAVNVLNNGCNGTLYRTSGPPGPTASPIFDPARVAVTAVGTVNLSFTSYSAALLTYTVNGTPGFKSITRQLF